MSVFSFFEVAAPLAHLSYGSDSEKRVAMWVVPFFTNGVSELSRTFFFLYFD